MAKAPTPFETMALGYEAWLLWFEASTVILLRLMLLTQGGPGAQSEAWRMVSEKWAAGLALGFGCATGTGGRTPYTAARRTMRHLRGRATANRRRLTRPPGQSKA